METSAPVWIAAIGVCGVLITSATNVVLAIINRGRSHADHSATQAKVGEVQTVVNGERTALLAEQARLQERVVALEKALAAKEVASAATALLEKAVQEKARENVRGEGP